MVVDSDFKAVASVPYLGDTNFGLAFDRFRRSIEAHSGAPFEDFGSGLPDQWEGYKEWVYHEGRRLLGFAHWRKPDVGTGKILAAAITAIEIHASTEYRNNLVQWDARYGDDARSHKVLLEAQGDPALTKRIENALFSLFCGEQSEEPDVFAELVECAGKRYDLLAYLFFLKDWTRFMPVKPAKFSQAFGLLDMPYQMAGKCSWENYQGYLERLNLVRRKLAEYQVPGNRLIDAHSFCWILVSLWDAVDRQSRNEWITSTPRAAVRPSTLTGSGDVGIEKTADDYLDEAQAKHALGALAQSIVLRAEISRLEEHGKGALASQVRDVSANPLLGYDISSYEVNGTPKYIEVKAASANRKYWRFFLSQNELEKSKQIDGYVFALVDRVHTPLPRIWEFAADQLPSDALAAVTYQVYVEAPDV